MAEKPTTAETRKKPRRQWFLRVCVTLIIFMSFAGGGFAPGIVVLTLVAVLTGLARALEIMERRQRSRDFAREQRARTWACPNCGTTFGNRSLYVAYGGSNPIMYCVVVCCECKHLNRFDSDGNPAFGLGVLAENIDFAALDECRRSQA
jgi:hypothetical protein